MSFPRRPYPSIAEYIDDYATQMATAMAAVSRSALEKAALLLIDCLKNDQALFSCGNGGSAAIANHLVCDHAKGISTDTGLRPRVQSLSATVEMLTALANDLEYAEVFSGQLKLFARPGDTLIAISSSGDSENIVRALTWARDNGLRTIALTGFEGGRASRVAEVNLHVPADNYGVIEDVHQALMHCLAQYVRQAHMIPESISIRRF